MIKLSLAVPCYNEEGNVEAFYNAAKKVFDGKISYEIIFVNDGSSDKTSEKLSEIADKNEENITVVNFSRNFGKESAVYAALKHSTGEYTCIIDADMQQRPETVLEMMKILDENPDVDIVAAYQEKRIENKFMSFAKSAFYKIVNKVCETKFYPNASDFRIFRKNVLNAVLSLSETSRFSKGIFSWVGFNARYIPYTADERLSGESKWNFGKLMRYAVNGMISYTVYPLKFLFETGAFLFAAGLIWLIVDLIIKASNVPLLMAFITIMTGIIVMSAGILGIYIGRIYGEEKARPVYIEKSVLTCRKEDDDE